MPPGESDWLAEGVAAARAGEAGRARASLLRAIEAEPNSVQAWYWLSRVVDDPEERAICLENVLILDPGHLAVQAELEELRRASVRANAESLLSREALAAAVPRSEEEALLADAAVEPLLCPYCGAPDPPQARQCSACGQALYHRRPRSRKHSIYSWLLITAWVALANCLWLATAGAYLVACVFPDGGGALGALQTLPGLEGLVLPDFDLPLLPLLLITVPGFCFCLFVAWGLYRRWRAFYWLTMGLVVAYPLVAIYWLASREMPSWPVLVVQGLLFLGALALTSLAYEEYTWVDERLHADVDRDVDSASALYARGEVYRRQEMWAKAAAHWARAVALSPGHPDYQAALGLAYANLGRPDRAAGHLAQARQIDPGHPLALEVEAHLDELGFHREPGGG